MLNLFSQKFKVHKHFLLHRKSSSSIYKIQHYFTNMFALKKRLTVNPPKLSFFFAFLFSMSSLSVCYIWKMFNDYKTAPLNCKKRGEIFVRIGSRINKPPNEIIILKRPTCMQRTLESAKSKMPTISSPSRYHVRKRQSLPTRPTEFRIS